jgi:hypothetical protein
MLRISFGVQAVDAIKHEHLHRPRPRVQQKT